MSPIPSNAAAAPGGSTIPGLDGVRALAVGIVFLAHAGLEHVVPGGLGVTIFFVLSGYLITTLMLRELAGRGSLDLGAFYLRRLLRLMPPLVLVATAAALAARAGWIDGPFSPSGLLSVLFYWGNYFVIAHDFDGVPHGLGVVWSLAVEEHYYLIYPFLLPPLLRLAGRRRAAAALLGACGAVLAWRCFLYGAGASEAWLTMATDARIDAILAGGVLALGLNPLEAARRGAPSRRVSLLLPAACVVVMFGTLLLRDEWFRLTLRYTLQSAAVAGLLYSVVAATRNPVWRLLDTRLMRWLGTLSYSIYLSHQILIYAIAKHWQVGAVPVALIAAALTLLLAEAMRRWVEEPCARLRRRLHQRGSLPAGAAAVQGGA